MWETLSVDYFVGQAIFAENQSHSTTLHTDQQNSKKRNRVIKPTLWQTLSVAYFVGRAILAENISQSITTSHRSIKYKERISTIAK